MSHQEKNVLGAVSDVAIDAKDKEQAITRRARNRIRGLSHHAYYTTDAEKTRHFYEDILELPMTIALRIPDEVFTGKPSPYCHFFFEMGDGSFSTTRIFSRVSRRSRCRLSITITSQLTWKVLTRLGTSRKSFRLRATKAPMSTTALSTPFT
jgi:hypothetical protein